MKITPARIVAFLLALSLAATVAACSEDGDATGGVIPSDEVLTVVATTPHVADLVRSVGGDRVVVETLLDVNVDPHDYEPRPSDVEALANARLMFVSGGDIDTWAIDLAETAGGDIDVVSLIDSVETIEGGHGHDDEHADEEGEEDIDPHWWQDLRNADLAIGAIEEALTNFDPENTDYFEANASEFVANSRGLDAQIELCFEAIPDEDRKMVTTHDSLGYFARRYDIDVVGSVLPALTTQAQPSSREISDLVEEIREEGVTAIFTEAGVNADLEDAVAKEAGVVVGDELWLDTLGPEGTPHATLLGAMTANANAIAAAFTGDEKGCGL